MKNVIFTVDYEIHGNGDGDPYKLMIEPTYRMLKQFDKFGAKLTIMADVAEILKFKEYYDLSGEDKYYYQDIVKQLQYAISSGHDVQLHVHSSYFGAKYENGRWLQNWEAYNLAELPYQTIYEIIKNCKEWLEFTLKSEKSDYKCNVFRAANWSMMPSKNIVSALLANGVKADTSVYKYGKKSGIVNYDYTNAHDSLIPWRIDTNSICKEDKNGKLIEFPIYCENRHFYYFITFIRAYRIIRAMFHKHRIQAESKISINNISNRRKTYNRISETLLSRHPWKLDFNQATGRQLINALKRIEKRNINNDIPIVLIGHSKSFIKYNEVTLEQFLKYVSKSAQLTFGTFQDFI